MSVPERLVAARKMRMMTRKDLSETTGLSVDYIKKLENGTESPSSSELFKIAQVLELKSEFFFRGPILKLTDVCLHCKGKRIKCQ